MICLKNKKLWNFKKYLLNLYCGLKFLTIILYFQELIEIIRLLAYVEIVTY